MKAVLEIEWFQKITYHVNVQSDSIRLINNVSLVEVDAKYAHLCNNVMIVLFTLLL